MESYPHNCQSVCILSVNYMGAQTEGGPSLVQSSTIRPSGATRCQVHFWLKNHPEWNNMSCCFGTLLIQRNSLKIQNKKVPFYVRTFLCELLFPLTSLVRFERKSQNTMAPCCSNQILTWPLVSPVGKLHKICTDSWYHHLHHPGNTATCSK